MRQNRTASMLWLLVAAVVVGGCAPLGVSVRVGPSREDVRAFPVAGVGDARARDKVAMISVRGLIADAPEPGLFGERPGPLDELATRLAMAEADRDIKAVVLRIDSPGGTVTGSDMAYREVARFRERSGKPVVVSLGEVAASGGYYLALAGDRVLAEPTTLTGSIGVLIATVNVSEGLSRLGIHSRFVTSGPNKDLANPLEPIDDAHYDILRGVVDEYYQRFRSLVERRRPDVEPSRLAEATDGRVVTGAVASELGLVDSLGGVREAFDTARSLAGLERAALVRFGSAADPPRTAYARGGVPTPTAADASTNLVRIDGAGLAMPWGRLRPGVGYYVWIP